MAAALMTSQTVRPFSTAKISCARPQRRSVMAIRASAEPNKVAKNVLASLTAATIAVTGPAFAFDLPGFSTGRDSQSDSEARASIDSSEKKGPAVQSRSLDTSGVDTYNSSGTQQADARYPGGREPRKGPGFDNMMDPKDQAAQLPDTRGPGAGGAADKAFDPKQAVIDANKRGEKNAFATAANSPASFTTFDTASLQKSVAFGIGEVGTTRDQAEGRGKALQGSSDNTNDSIGADARRAGREAKAVFSNPAGPGQTKVAADKVSKANSEISKALSGNSSKPVSFSVVEAPVLQSLEV